LDATVELVALGSVVKVIFPSKQQVKVCIRCDPKDGSLFVSAQAFTRPDQGAIAIIARFVGLNL
jgi:hypothetical protein